MQKLLNKFIAVIITVMMVSANMAPAMVYAANSLSQNSKTKEENVEFNAIINNDYNATLDVNSEGTLLLSLKVSETGYLKDGVVTLKDNNYEVIDNGNLNVKSIKDNVIELYEVNAGEVLNVSLPIRLKKEEKVYKDILGKDSTVTLNAIYVNEKGKEKKIQKTLTEHIEWTAEAKELVKQDLIRYIKFDNKTMVSFKITEGIENNQIPAESKEIIVNVPSLNNNKPSNVIVTGKGISYTYKDDAITIKKENKPDSENKIVWNSQEEYIVTYIYDAQVDITKINSQVVSRAKIKGNIVEGSLENYTYELKEQLGQYVEAETDGTTELSKGYMYANIKNRENNLETAFEVRLKANVGFKDITDSIKIVESHEMFNNIDASNFITNKKVRVEKDNLIEILGEEGTIKVLSNDGTELGTLTKDNNELEVNTERVILETSKVVKEGDLEVILSKVINSNITFNKQQLSDLKEIKTTAIVYGYKDEKENSSKEVSKVINLTEPTSNAQLDVNVQNLSTVVKNEDVILTATLETNDISDALYSNVKANIILPQEVKEINVKEARLIYENELELNNVGVNDNRIILNLDGNQTKYSTQSTSNGTVVRIVADLTLDNLAPTNEKEIDLVYLNEENGEQKSVSSPVGIVAPTGFVTTNSLEIDGQKVTSQESNEQLIKINSNSNEKIMNISATVVNNLALDATGVTILGTIPTSGNKDANEIDLGSNFDTVLNSAINVSKEDVQIYYSENANETVNGGSWKTEYTPNAKSYKIVLLGTLSHGAVVNFGYSVKVPANLSYGKTSKASYGVYYNNNAEQGNNQNLVLAKAVGITTGEIPIVTAQSSFIEANTNKELENGADVKEGKTLIYRVVVKNTGKESAKNVKVRVNIPDGMEVVNLVKQMSDLPMYSYDSNTKILEETIENIDPESSKTVECRLVVSQIRNVENEDNEEDEENDTKQTVVTTISSDELEANVTSERTIKAVKGDITATVTSDKKEKNLKQGDVVQYYLSVRNANFETKNNLKATIVLPKEFSLERIVNNQGTNYTIDENTNTIVYTNPTLNGNMTDGVLIEAKVKESKDAKVGITAKIKCNEMNEEENLETINYNITNSIISASLSSSINQNELSDTDELEYYVNLKNNSSDTVNVQVKDAIPEGLRVVAYEVKDSLGNNRIEANSRNIMTSLQLNAEENARLTIMTEPYTLQNGRILKIDNKAEITFEDIVADTNNVSHTIVGTSKNSVGSSITPEGEPGTGNTDNEQAVEGTYRISGEVWVDANSNGRKEDGEDKLSGLTVKLYDRNSGKIALDANGKEQSKTTNDLGKYTFINVDNGNYIVVVEYDNLSYDLANYKVEGLAESENSDFVLAEIDGKTVAATDEIVIDNSNTYNVDLGLVKGTIFDLDISKTVTRISVTNTKAETRTYDYDELSVAKVELATANVEFATVLVEYTIKVQNNGQVAGYAKSIVDYIPQGMTFNSELNNTWYLGQDGNAYNTSLANTIINPGETKEIKLVLNRKMSSENTGTVRNSSGILTSYNEYGLVDRDAQSGEIEKSEDKSAADVVIAMATGREVASFTGITLGILVLIAFAVHEIKKRIINKMYNDII